MPIFVTNIQRRNGDDIGLRKTVAPNAGTALRQFQEAESNLNRDTTIYSVYNVDEMTEAVPVHGAVYRGSYCGE